MMAGELPMGYFLLKTAFTDSMSMSKLEEMFSGVIPLWLSINMDILIILSFCSI